MEICEHCGWDTGENAELFGGLCPQCNGELSHSPNRKETEDKRATALQAVAAWKIRNEGVMKELDGLRKEVDQYSWPPKGYCACEDEECELLFPIGKMPPGWFAPRYSCGCGEMGSYYCPSHRNECDPDREQCGECSR